MGLMKPDLFGPAAERRFDEKTGRVDVWHDLPGELRVILLSIFADLCTRRSDGLSDLLMPEYSLSKASQNVVSRSFIEKNAFEDNHAGGVFLSYNPQRHLGPAGEWS